MVTDHVMGHPVLGAHMRETQKMVPDSWEWRIPSPVGNQGTCGACFAFATIAQLESWIDSQTALNVTDVSNCVSHDCSGASLYDVYSFLQASGANTADRSAEPCYSADRDVAVLEFAIGYFPENNDLERHFPGWLRQYGPIVVGVDAE
ncbi:MAG: C1 family peptidase, partial [Anaerolineales bacterium]|nr:C1 family peptidase [Anaerolineales bacterium]